MIMLPMIVRKSREKLVIAITISIICVNKQSTDILPQTGFMSNVQNNTSVLLKNSTLIEDN